MSLPYSLLTFCLPLLWLLPGPKAHAQYIFSPSTQLEISQSYNSLTYDSINIANLSSDTLQLDWTLLSYDSVAGTQLDFCTSGVCFGGFPLLGSFPPIVPGGFGYAGAHFWTGNAPATSTAKIWLYPQGDFAHGDTLTFISRTKDASGIADQANSGDAIKLFPNPATTTLCIEGIETNLAVSVYNSNGRLMLIKILTANQLDISSLSKGLYLIKLNSAGNKVVSKFVKE